MPNTIAQNLQRLQTARTDIANAITTMGGTVAAGDGFEDFPAGILGIPAGSTSGAAYYTKFPRTSTGYGKLGFGIVGNKGEQGEIFIVNTDGVSPDSTSYNTVQLNDFNLSDYLSQDHKFTMRDSTNNYFYATFDITNNAIVFSKGNFISASSGYYAACASITL